MRLAAALLTTLLPIGICGLLLPGCGLAPPRQSDFDESAKAGDMAGETDVAAEECPPSNGILSTNGTDDVCTLSPDGEGWTCVRFGPPIADDLAPDDFEQFGIQSGTCVADVDVLATNLGVFCVRKADASVFMLPVRLGTGTGGSSSLGPILALEGDSCLVGHLGGQGSPLDMCHVDSAECMPIPDGVLNGHGITSLLKDPASSAIYAGTEAFVARSMNGGLDWQKVNGVSTSVRTLAPFNGGIFVGTLSQGLFEIKTTGSDATPVTGGGLPSNPRIETIVPAGAKLHVLVQSSTIVDYTSTDGATYLPSGALAGARVCYNGAAHQAINAPGIRIYVGTNAGVYRSTDDGASFSPFNSGLRTATVERVVVGADHVFAGTSGGASGLFRSTDRGADWLAASENLDGQVVRAIASEGSFVVASGETGVFRSTDGGADFVRGVNGLPAGSFLYALTTAGSKMLGTVNPPANPSGIEVSTDGGATWKPSNTGLPQPITLFSIASSGSMVVAGASDGRVFRSMDGGGTWSPGTGFPGNNVFSLTFSNAALYAGLLGSSKDNVQRSTDFGMNWSPVTAGLGGTTVYSLAAAPPGPGSTRAALAVPAEEPIFAGTSRGVYWSTDGGASWTLFSKSLFGTAAFSLAATADTLYVGTVGAAVRTFALPPVVSKIVPIVLDVVSGAAHFTTELALANRGGTKVALSLHYTASIGSGSGDAAEELAAGQQLVIPDAISYLRGKGVPIPASGSQGGTLLVKFNGLGEADVVSVTARTTTATAAPQPVGSAGLAYSAISPAEGSTGSVTVYGLRSNESDRSNLAVFSTSAEPVTLKVTAFSGDGDGKNAVIAAGDTLPAYGWKQYNGILATAGIANGYVTVERVSAAGAFSTYGVVNDNGTSDGSFLLPRGVGGILPFVNVPVLVETPAFRSELVLANSGATAASLTLTYAESLSPAGGAGGAVNVNLAPHTQRIIGDAIDFLRKNGTTLGARGAASYAGSLHVAISGASVFDVFAGARTASLSPAAGQFGLFTPAIYPGAEAAGQAFIYGLRSDGNNRSNVAVANTGLAAPGPVTLQIQAYDGNAGGVAKGAADSVTLAPGHWQQIGNFLGTKGVTNGWVKITRTSGSAPWIAYGVVNDGGVPGQRTGDGAYVPMTR